MILRTLAIVASVAVIILLALAVSWAGYMVWTMITP
jgi:hypothetical protein